MIRQKCCICYCLKCCSVNTASFFHMLFFSEHSLWHHSCIYLTDLEVTGTRFHPSSWTFIHRSNSRPPFDESQKSQKARETHGKLCYWTDLIMRSTVIIQSWTTRATKSPVIELHINLMAEMIPSVTAGFTHTHAGHMLSAASRSHGPACYVKLAAWRSVGGQSQSRVFGWSFGLEPRHCCWKRNPVLHGKSAPEFQS